MKIAELIRLIDATIESLKMHQRVVEGPRAKSDLWQAALNTCAADCEHLAWVCKYMVECPHARRRQK